MNDLVHHRVPRLAAVLQEQFGAVGIGLRRELIIGAVFVMFITLLVFIMIARDGGTVSLSPDGAGFVLAWIGLLAPLAVWKGEGPSARGYFWSLPVARGRHTLLKVFAGWAWLMIVLAVFIGWVALQAWVSGGSPGIDEIRFVMAAGGPLPSSMRVALDPALVREVHWTTPGWQWVVPFAAPTVAYLVGTVAALRSDFPWLWLAAPFIAFLALGMVAGAADISWLVKTGDHILAGPYGLETLLTGSNEAAVRVQLVGGAEVHVWRDLAVATQWCTTFMIWFVPSLAAALFAARGYQER
jgi:hypothetical protein